MFILSNLRGLFFCIDTKEKQNTFSWAVPVGEKAATSCPDGSRRKGEEIFSKI